MIKAIETSYKGYKFRSRLEARWAVYFDTLGITWEYEPEGFELRAGLRYLPDFWLPQVNMWAEVKSDKLTTEEMLKAVLLADMTKFPVIALVGTPGYKSYWVIDPSMLESDKEDMFCLNTYEFNDAIVDNTYLDENRFYMSTGDGANYINEDTFNALVKKAVESARSARFEFGGRLR